MLYVRETISAIAQRHGLLATFLAKPFATAAGSGAHTHFSLQSTGDGKAVLADLEPGLDGKGSLAENFLAGDDALTEILEPCVANA